jgi:hypothetical protein
METLWKRYGNVKQALKIADNASDTRLAEYKSARG